METTGEKTPAPARVPPKPLGGRPARWPRTLALAIKLVLAAAAVGAAVYWFRFAPVAVARHVVTRGDVVAEVMGTGTIEARLKADIGPKISGLVTEVLVDQGDRVQAGQVLMKIDDRDLKRQVEAVEAGVEAASAALDRLLADRKRVEAILEQARREHGRQEGLMKNQISSSDDVDRAVEALRVAEANMASADAAIAEGRKTLIAAEKTLEFHRARLADTVVLAPFAGIIVHRGRDPGSIVVPGATVLSLVSTDEIWVSAWVDETEMSRLKPGQEARVVFRSEPDRAYEGDVARLGRQADRETREFIVDVRVRSLPENWAIGQRAEVYIDTGRREAVPVLPVGLVIWRDETPGVFVEKNRRAEWAPLKLGVRGREMVEIVAGLEPGQDVISPNDPKASLKIGQRVEAR